MKPAVPSAWTHQALQEIVDEKKAIIVTSSDELISLYTKIATYNGEMIIQEYVVGNDDNHHDLHVYMNKNSEPVAVFTGIKTRIYPAYAGTGCFVESVYIKELAEQGVRMLKQINFTGLANINYKKDSISQEYKLFEINPRVSSWNLLDTACGVNLPYIAYADTVGVDYSRPGPQKENVKYVFLKSDIKAFLEYRKNGDWTLRTWLQSLRGKLVYQMYAPDDLKPFVVDLTKTIFNLLKRIFR
jgi:D-aspartate ligase